MIWSLFRRQPASFADTPRLKRYTVALSESVPELTDHWRGQHLMPIAASSPEQAKELALAKARRYKPDLGDGDVLEVKGGERDA